MASIFTYEPNPPRVSSPWSTPGSRTPTAGGIPDIQLQSSGRGLSQSYSSPVLLQDTGIVRLEPEPQEGSTEYKLHLLLRPRRTFTSSTTGMDIYGSSHSRPVPPASTVADKDLQIPKSGYGPSHLTRQIRLQQLTTQLLWRLQQSSPFHSSSRGDLVLPKLPEASPQLGVPANRAALLPGLEESQGALYEIGVSDDGALVGLIEEELEESLVNLQAMAASLGCVVELLRKVAVGKCEWVNPDSQNLKESIVRSTLWVAETLVRPDVEADASRKVLNQPTHFNGAAAIPTDDVLAEAAPSRAEQLRVTLLGSTTAGKSSLLGTLSTSTLDNGRGKSRLSLLRHRHEIASGVTSSVAQELIGYHVEADEDSRDTTTKIVNYATSDVSSWIDIHHLAERLVFMSDSPGHPRYAKSTFRTLISWQPHWTVVCVPSDEDEPETGKLGATTITIDNNMDSHLSLAYITLALKLKFPMVIAVTKMDLATKTGLRLTLAKVLSTLKEAGRQPIILSNTPVPGGETSPDLQHVKRVEYSEVSKLLASPTFSSGSVPIVLTSAVTGLGIGKLHALLSSLSILPAQDLLASTPSNTFAGGNLPAALFDVDEVFMIPPSKVYGSHMSNQTAEHGVVLCGHVATDWVSVGDVLSLGPFSTDSTSIETRQSSSMRRSSSHSASLSRSHPINSSWLGTTSTSNSNRRVASIFADVRVVSIRNLRLPVRTLLEGQVGTVGVQLINPDHCPKISRSRKGMVLMRPTTDVIAYRSIRATFPAGAFAAPNSPTLILGGHAMLYVNAVRAAVKVTSLDLAPLPHETSSVFDFEDEQDGDDNLREVTITFRFVSSFEWMAVGSKILVIPTASTTGPIAGQVNMVGNVGLSGFVGTVCETVI